MTLKPLKINITELKVGNKVHYQPDHYSANKWENGIIKEIPDFETDKTSQVGYNCVRVVYNCAGNWDNYKDYTSALTNLRDLKLGWKSLLITKICEDCNKEFETEDSNDDICEDCYYEWYGNHQYDGIFFEDED